MSEQFTHYRKVFDSPYLSAADVFDPITLTIARVTQETDKTKKTKDTMNTAYFVEREIRPGEKLKPMILNATNSKILDKLMGTPFIEGWAGARIVVYVETGIKFGRDTVDGLRIRPAPAKTALTPEDAGRWEAARNAALQAGCMDAVLSRVEMSPEHIALMESQCREIIAKQEGAE